jgi:hypothetical protein
MTVKGTKLIIEVDLSKDFGNSASGKTKIIATTAGNQAIEGGGGAVIGLNVYRKA